MSTERLPEDKFVMRMFVACLACGGVATAALGAAPSSYPTKPVRMIAVNLPGGGADIVARLVGPKLTQSLSQPFVVDNRPAVSGVIGTDMVAKSAPDGYTLLMGSSSSHTVTASLFSDLPFNPVKDFAPITMLASTPYLMVAHPSLAASSVSEVIKLARSQPGKLNYAVGGIAVGSTLAGELFKSMAEVNIVMVPYKGSPQAISELVGGHVQLAFSTMPTGLPLVKSGRLRALGVTSLQRIESASAIPTIAESGLPGFDVQTWFGMLAPRATPDSVIRRLHGVAVSAARHPDVREKLIQLGYTIVGNTPEQFSDLIRTEIAKWTKVVKTAGLESMSMKQ